MRAYAGKLRALRHVARAGELYVPVPRLYASRVCGDNSSMLAQFVVYADSTQFKGDLVLTKNGVTTTFGSEDSDSFTINSTGEILLMETNKYNLGSSSFVWDKVYANSLRNGSGVYIDLGTSKIEFGKNGALWSGINSDGYYDASGNQLATRSFVNSAVESPSFSSFDITSTSTSMYVCQTNVTLSIKS